MIQMLPETQRWLGMIGKRTLEKEILAARRRVSSAAAALERLAPPVRSFFVEIEKRSLDPNRAEAEREYRDAADDCAFRESSLRYKKLIEAGQSVEVIDFLNSVNESQSSAREHLLACVEELIALGDKLLGMERRIRPKTRKSAMTLKELRRLSPADFRKEMTRLLRGSAFQRALKIAEGCHAEFPLTLFGFVIEEKPPAGDPVAIAVWKFLRIADAVDPRLWRICGNCQRVFLQQQIKRPKGASYCFDLCRAEHHNRSKERLIIRLYHEAGGFRKDPVLATRIKESLVLRFRSAARMTEDNIIKIGREALQRGKARGNKPDA